GVFFIQFLCYSLLYAHAYCCFFLFFVLLFVFFFQAEDGIRDRNVTGVQTCALPILQETWGKIVSEWLPSSGYELVEAPEISFTGDLSDKSNVYSEIWIAVKKKE